MTADFVRERIDSADRPCYKNRMLVLLVEDNDDSRELYRHMLEKLGHKVIEATNGKEALKVAIKQSPEIVIMDLSMPEVDGFQATSALRSIKTFSRTPILAITAYPKSHWQDKAEDAGCDAFLQKPFTHEDLSAALDKLIAA
jgi:two-component system, cell cycle response regulator DivK